MGVHRLAVGGDPRCLPAVAFPFPQCGDEPGGARIVHAGHHETVRVDPVDEPRERDLDVLGPAVVVEMVGFDIGDDRTGRFEEQESAVALVRLGDEDLAGPGMRVGAGLVDVTSDHERRVGAACLQCNGGHQGGRRLPMGPGDGQPARTPHQRCERGGPGDDMQAAPSRLLDLGVSVRNRPGEDHGTGVPEMGRIMTDSHHSAERPQCGQPTGVPGVASGHGRAAPHQQPRQPAHAGAADPDEVDAVELIR